MSKISIASATGRGRACPAPTNCRMVGLGGIEPPTSPLSGVRSSQLSYRPGSPTWWSWSGSNRRPPECKSGALPAELQPQNFGGRTRAPPPILNRGQLDAETMGPAHGRLGKTLVLQVEIRCELTALAEARTAVWKWNDCSLLKPGVHSTRLCS